jgi:GNAT superfamily N-acetyltransferase
VTPEARGRGIGESLLAEIEAAARAGGARRLRTLDLPGNYLAPGIDVRNHETIAWFERRGYRKTGENTNLLIDVRGNPRIAQPCATPGYQVRRARGDEAAALHAAIAEEFGGAWPFEAVRALAVDGVHVAIKMGDPGYAAFAAHDGNNQGLGWFGPAGTWAGHRGRGLGEALLRACLRDVAAAHPQCEVAWIGPRRFYEQSAGVAGERRFIVMTKDLS